MPSVDATSENLSVDFSVGLFGQNALPHPVRSTILKKNNSRFMMPPFSRGYNLFLIRPGHLPSVIFYFKINFCPDDLMTGIPANILRLLPGILDGLQSSNLHKKAAPPAKC